MIRSSHQDLDQHRLFDREAARHKQFWPIAVRQCSTRSGAFLDGNTTSIVIVAEQMLISRRAGTVDVAPNIAPSVNPLDPKSTYRTGGPATC